VRAGHRFRLRAAITIEGGQDAREREQRPVVALCEPDDVLLLRLRVWLRRVLGEAVNSTRQRCSGFSQPRQCGEPVLRMLVTGGPPVRGGGGIPQRIMASSRPSPSGQLRMTGAEYPGRRPAAGEIADVAVHVAE
jgi:hypothetical protein